MDALNPIADLPMGLGMALAQDAAAMEHFSALSPDEQRRVIDRTHSVQSRDEMQALVRAITGGQNDF